ncbi:MAG: transcriptional regulator NanR [Azospirillaceae bacterium]
MASDIIPRRKLHEELADRLEALILSEDYSPGDQLPSERELMERYGVGRPTVRQALATLERMGLVRIASGERARVTKPSPKVLTDTLSGTVKHMLADEDGVRHFQMARLFFESGLARWAAEHATEEDIARLRAALEENRRHIHDPAEFNRTDVGFHYVLAMIPSNPIFVALHEALVGWLTEQRTISLRNEGASRHAFRAHEKIYEAVAAREPERAEQAMRAHLLDVSTLYWAQMDISGED